MACAGHGRRHSRNLRAARRRPLQRSMKIGLVSQYYAPETGATQNRMAAFTAGLAERGHEVVVICEQPNHPAGFSRPIGVGVQS